MLITKVLSIEYFTPDKWRKEIEELTANQPYIDAYIEELRNYATDPNNENYESAKGILKWIDDGEVEIVVEKEEIKFHTIPKKKVNSSYFNIVQF